VDFSLQTGSPAIDAGTTLAGVATDILGVARPAGAAYDLGAYEGVSVTPAVPTLIAHAETYVYAASLTVAKPTGTANGDVMWAWINLRWNSTVTTAPSGWTLIDSFQQTGGTQGGNWYLYRKVASGQGASYQWTFSQTQNHWACIVTTRGADTTTPLNAGGTINSTLASTTHAMTAITPTVANTLLLAFYSGRHGSATPSAYTPPSGMTEYVDFNNNYSGIGIASLDAPTAHASTGTKTATYGTSSDWGGVLVAVTPA